MTWRGLVGTWRLICVWSYLITFGTYKGFQYIQAAWRWFHLAGATKRVAEAREQGIRWNSSLHPCIESVIAQDMAARHWERGHNNIHLKRARQQAIMHTHTHAHTVSLSRSDNMTNEHGEARSSKWGVSVCGQMSFLSLSMASSMLKMLPDPMRQCRDRERRTWHSHYTM